MKRFVITMNATVGREPMDALNHSLIRWCARLDLVAIPIPNVVPAPEVYLEMVDGVILTGGNDVQAGLGSSTVSPERDRCEKVLLEQAISRRMPILGICRGMQFLNIFFAGSLCADLAAHGALNHAGKPHAMTLESSFANRFGVTGWPINSFHRQGVLFGQLAPDLRVLARADSVVEACYHPTLPVLGLQWHPERPDSTPDRDDALVRRFLSGELR